MQKNSFIDHVVNRFRIVALLGFLLAPGSAKALEIVESTCADAATDAAVLALNTSLRSHGEVEGRSRCFKLEAPAAGLMTLEVAVPGTAEVEAKLGAFSRDRGEPSQLEGDFTLIEHTASRLAVMTEAPGTYVFAVAAQDPRRSLGRFKLTAGFVAAETLDRAASDWSFEKDGEGEEDDDELELEPDAKSSLPFEKDGEGEEDDDELELEPDGKSSLPVDLWLPGDTPHSRLRELCRQLELDDHGDTFTCATRLRPGDVVAGEVRNPWGDDQDLFMFTLTEARTVEVATTGSSDTFGNLYDRVGHRLAADDDAGKDDNFRIVKTLSAGLYFVRVEGSHAAEGPYTLLVETPSW